MVQVFFTGTFFGAIIMQDHRDHANAVGPVVLSMKLLCQYAL